MALWTACGPLFPPHSFLYTCFCKVSQIKTSVNIWRSETSTVLGGGDSLERWPGIAAKKQSERISGFKSCVSQAGYLTFLISVSCLLK